MTVFMENGKEIRIAPLAMYAVLKEIHGIRRFQVLAYPENRLELRMEEAEGSDRSAVFEEARQCLLDYLSSQGIQHAEISLSEKMPQQDAGSGKFKHIINMQKE